MFIMFISEDLLNEIIHVLMRKTVQIRDMRLPIRVQEAMEMEVLLLYLVISNMKFLVCLLSGIFHES